MQDIAYDHLEKIRDLLLSKGHTPGSLRYHVATFGCQMNARDSEKLRGMLEYVGFSESPDEDCDIVIYNTCTVRENANQKVYGRLGDLKGKKKKNPFMKVVICGCMMEEKAEEERIKSSYPFVDIVFGTMNLSEFPRLLLKNLTDKEKQYEVTEIDRKNDDLILSLCKEDPILPTKRKYPFKSGVNITYGCNNFCSYCIVPFVRGPERSRRKDDILDEIRTLSKDGVIEIMLLGQNVNSYRDPGRDDITFPRLLQMVEKIDGIERIRFMTSHPKDLSDELISVIKSSKKICRHIHLPLQSGSTKVLSQMNRHYTKESYLSLVDRIRNQIPDISLTTDIMVGFPGESEEDFLETCDVVERAGFDSAFTFLYSRRDGTPAAGRADQIDEETMHERFERLLSLIHEKSGEVSKRFLGQTYPVLVEEENTHDPSLMTGRLPQNAIVHFKGDASLVGRIIPVTITESRDFYFFGESASS